ncbi:MAG: GNAT family N-acetyltransferase [Deinococcales bacterium]
MQPRPISLKTAPESELRLLHEFWNARLAEIFPEDPPVPWQEHLKQWREPAAHEVSSHFVLFEHDQLLGVADAYWHSNDTENPDVAWIEVLVVPEQQRRGFGTALCLALFEEIFALGRKKLFARTTSLRPGGKPFLELLGAKFGQEERINQLLVAELNRTYLRRSLENAPTDLYELVWYEDELPTDRDELQRLCNTFRIMNTAPRGELEFNDWESTPERVIEEYKNISKHGTKWILCLARHKQSGLYAGFTQMGWHPHRPKIGMQWGTGVDPAHRGHGLGAWLKAAMLERLLKHRPTVDRIRTSNANSNVPMLKINHTLGFKPFLENIEWQIDTAKALEILRARVSASTN